MARILKSIFLSVVLFSIFCYPNFSMNVVGVNMVQSFSEDSLFDNCVGELIVSSSFFIDVDVVIESPGCYIYLFDSKLNYSVDIPVLFGGFSIFVDVYPLENIEKLSFYLNDRCIGEDSEFEYSCFCGVRNFGRASIKVIAVTFSGESGEQSMDVLYFNF